MSPAALPDPLVSTEWLAARLGEPDLKVIDATFYESNWIFKCRDVPLEQELIRRIKKLL